MSSSPPKKKDDTNVLSFRASSSSDDEDVSEGVLYYNNYETFSEREGLINNKKSSVIRSFSVSEPSLEKSRNPFYGGKNHVFADPEVAEHYRQIYNNAGYEGRFHFDPTLEWTKEQETKLLWKIEYKACFWACFMFFALQLDRGNISQALSDNMLSDLKLNTNDYNAGQTIFLTVFLLSELPSQLIAKKMGPDRWIPAQMTLWSLVAISQSFISGKKSFFITRGLLGFLEGGFIAEIVSWLSYFYTSSELPLRLSFFWTAGTLTTIGSSLIAFVILRLRNVGGWEGWRWLFFIEGFVTLVIGIASFFKMPASPVQTKTWFRPNGWFTEFEEKLIVNRVLRDDPSKGDMHNRQAVSFKQLGESLLDYDLWPLYLIGLISYIPTNAVSSYFTLNLRQLGFSTFYTNLLTIPPNVIHIILLISQTWLTEHLNERSFISSLQPLWVIPCGAVLAFWSGTLHNVWGTYTVLVILLSGPYIHAILVGWCSRNSNAVRTRTVSAAVYNMFVQGGSVISSNIYRKDDAPYYKRGNRVIFILSVVSLFLILGTKAYYMWRNKRRDEIWGAMTEEERIEYRKTTTDEGNKRLDFRFSH